MSNFQIMVDSVHYRGKPDKYDISKIKSRLATECSTPLDFSLDALKATIEAGRTVCPAIIAPSTNDNGNPAHNAAGWQRQQLFMIDIDNDRPAGKGKKERLPDGEYIESGKALEMLEALEIKPLIAYHSFSNGKDGIEKYRVGVLLDTVVTDPEERLKIVTTLIGVFGKATDHSCTNADRIFFGSKPESVFYYDPDATTPKSTILGIYEQMNEIEVDSSTEPEYLPGIKGYADSSTNANRAQSSAARYEAAKNPQFDMKPETLLYMIDPNALDYGEWIKITAGYKNAGGDRSTWDSWCSQYAENDSRVNDRTWKTCGKSGQNGKATIGTLKRRAHEYNPTAYEAYKDILTQAQRDARKAEKQKSKPTTTPQDSLSDAAPELKLPSWIVPTKDGKTLRISPVKLEKEIRGKYKIIYTKSGDVSGKSVFVYIPSKGFYKYADTKSFATMIKAMVDKFNEKSPVLLDNYRKARDEAIEYLNTYVQKDTYRPEELDSEEDLMNCENGMVNLKTGEILNHSPKFRSTRQLPVKYYPDKHYTLDDAPRFAKYLDYLTAGDPDRKQLLLEYAGAVFSSVDGSRYKRILYLVGAGDSGKSQYVKLIARITGEDFAAPTKFNMLDKQFQNAVIVGKRFVYDPDLAIETAVGNNTLMCCTGGDAISIERKGQEAFSYRFKGFLCVCSNEMPKTRGNLSKAYYNRLIICQCPNAVPKAKQDKSLLEKLLTEKDAIVSICLDAYKATTTDARNYSFTVPKDNEDFIKELKAENDSTSEFFADYCKLYERKELDGEPYKRQDFYAVYTDWFRKNYPHRTTPSSREFFKNMRDFFGLQDDCRKSHGTRFSLVTLTLEGRNELRQGTKEIDGNSEVLDGIAGYAETEI